MPAASPFADVATALGLGLIVGIVLHVAQNARLLVQRIPQTWLQMYKDNEELTSLITVALCVAYSIPRLWFFLRQNRKSRSGIQSNGQEQQQQQEDERFSELPTTDAAQNNQQSNCNVLSAREGAPPIALAGNHSQSPAELNLEIAGSARATRASSDKNEFIGSAAVVSSGPSPSTGAPAVEQQTNLLDGAMGAEALPDIRQLPLHSRLGLAKTSPALHDAVFGGGDAWQHTAVDASIVDGRDLTDALRLMGPHVRTLVFSQGSKTEGARPGMNRLGDGDVCSAIAECPQLTELDCSFTSCCSDLELFKAARGQRCPPKLRVLNVRYCSRVTDLGLVEAVRLFGESLRVVRCSGNHAVTDVFLNELSARCPNLQELDCSNTQVSSSGVSLVLKRCLQLQKLYVAHCPLVTDTAFYLPASTSNTGSNHLDAPLSFSSWFSALIFAIGAVVTIAVMADVDAATRCTVCASVAAVGCVIIACVSLNRSSSTKLEIAPAEHAMTKRRPAANVPGSQLTSVDLSGLVDLSHIGLKLLVDRCSSSLKHFVLQSSRISENYLQQMFRECSGLEVVLLEGCNMNDATVQVLASSCPKLKEVSIKGSMSCSDKSVHLLLQEKNCPHLHTLDMRGCNVTMKASHSSLRNIYFLIAACFKHSK